MKKLMGVVVGVNLAVACMMMQGCKAPRAGAPAQRSVKPKAVATAPAENKKAEPLPPAPVAEPAAVQEVKPLPPAPVEEPKTVAAPEQVETPAVYVVKSGDVLSRICRRHGVKQAAVLKLNPGLKPNRLSIGQKIKLPVAVKAAATAPVQAPEAKAGPVKPQANAKPVESKPVEAKQAKKADAKGGDAKPADDKSSAKAKGPSKAASTKAPVVTKASFKSYSGPTKEYVVVNGDNVGKIAYNCGISMRALKELNGLKSTNLSVGQKLKVPAEKQTFVQQEGEPVSKKVESKVSGGTEKAVENKNVPAKIEPPVAGGADQEKKEAAVETKSVVETPAETKAAEIPADAAATAKAEPEPAAAPALTHVVKEGEDLVTIAINYGASLMELKELNNIDDDGEVLKPGSVLKLPAGSKRSAQ